MNWIDFLIGGLIANAMPHFIMGITNTRFLGMFGFSSKGNILYGVVQFVIALMLLVLNYGTDEVCCNGFVMAPMAVVLVYLLVGRYLVKKFQKKS